MSIDDWTTDRIRDHGGFRLVRAEYARPDPGMTRAELFQLRLAGHLVPGEFNAFAHSEDKS